EAHSAGEGRGSRFTFKLPSIDPAPKTHPIDAPAPPARAGGCCRILLVEDHKDTAKLMARILEGEGHRVRTAGSAGEALRLAGSERFDLVISDLGLPDATGFELMREIRERHGLPGIALSGREIDDD